MRLVDANLLVDAFTTSFAHHERARAWLDEQLSASSSVGLPWPSRAMGRSSRGCSLRRVFGRNMCPMPIWRRWLWSTAWPSSPPPRTSAVFPVSAWRIRSPDASVRHPTHVRFPPARERSYGSHASRTGSQTPASALPPPDNTKFGDARGPRRRGVLLDLP